MAAVPSGVAQEARYPAGTLGDIQAVTIIKDKDGNCAATRHHTQQRRYFHVENIIIQGMITDLALHGETCQAQRLQ